MPELSEFLITGLVIALALFAGRAASSVGFPRVAAYLLVGILFSPGLLGNALGLELGAWKDSFTTGALGVIAYLIGGSMTISQLRKMGRVIIASTLGESLGALLAVFLAVFAFLSLSAEAFALSLALAMGVLAVSTDAVSTLAVIHQFRAKGPLTDTLLGVVALDDAVGIISFSVLLAFLANADFSGIIADAVMGIGGAIAAGALAAWALCRVSAYFGESTARLPLILSCVFVVVGIADTFGLAVLLAAMSLGFFTRLFATASARRLFDPVYALEETIFILFFALAGMNFDVLIFQHYAGLIVAYVLARILGKLIGAMTLAKLCGAPIEVARWLGFGLVPQAGVAVGLALIISQQHAFADSGQLLLNLIVGTTLIYELTGPLAVKFALHRAGEVRLKREKHRHAGF